MTRRKTVMTKSKVILRDGTVLRINLHPYKAETCHSAPMLKRVFGLIHRGARLLNRSF